MDEQKQDDQLELTYIHLSADTGCNLEDQPEAMYDREWWWERESLGDLCWLHDVEMIKKLEID